MRLGLSGSTRTSVRLPVAVFTAVCGAATAAGSLLTWLSARGARPGMGVRHTSLARMLALAAAGGCAQPGAEAMAGAGRHRRKA